MALSAVPVLAAMALAAAAAPSDAPPRARVKVAVSASVEVLRAERVGDFASPDALYRRHRPEAGGTVVDFN